MYRDLLTGEEYTGEELYNFLFDFEGCCCGDKIYQDLITGDVYNCSEALVLLEPPCEPVTTITHSNLDYLNAVAGQPYEDIITFDGTGPWRVGINVSDDYVIDTSNLTSDGEGLYYTNDYVRVFGTGSTPSINVQMVVTNCGHGVFDEDFLIFDDYYIDVKAVDLTPSLSDFPNINVGGTTNGTLTITNIGNLDTFSVVQVVLLKPIYCTVSPTLPAGWSIASDVPSHILIQTNNIIGQGAPNAVSIPISIIQNGTSETVSRVFNVNMPATTGEVNTANNTAADSFNVAPAPNLVPEVDVVSPIPSAPHSGNLIIENIGVGSTSGLIQAHLTLPGTASGDFNFGTPPAGVTITPNFVDNRIDITTSNVIAPGDANKLIIPFTFYPPIMVDGPMTLTILDGSGGETNNSDNVDTKLLTYLD